MSEEFNQLFANKGYQARARERLENKFHSYAEEDSDVMYERVAAFEDNIISYQLESSGK